jgi:hypothetical protein
MIHHTVMTSTRVAAALMLLGTLSTQAQNTVVKPKIDAEGVTNIAAGNRTYPGNPPVTVNVKDLLEDGKYFEHQVQGQSDNGVTKPSWSVFPNLNPGPHSFAFSVPKSTVDRVRSEFWFEGSRPNGYSYGTNPWTDPTHSNWIPFNQYRTTGFNLYLPRPAGTTDDQRKANVGNGIIMQWWQYSPANPPMSLTFTVSGGLPRLVLKVDASPDEGSATAFDVYYPLTWNDLNNWFDICVAYTLSKTATGSVQMWFKKHGETAWRDAKLTSNNTVLAGNDSVKKTDIAIGFDHPNGISHKIGIYRPWTGSNAWTIRYDNVYNGSSTAEVNAAWTAW